jgi:hypothetical protein
MIRAIVAEVVATILGAAEDGRALALGAPAFGPSGSGLLAMGQDGASALGRGVVNT